jgi:hypothetical protein
LVPLLEFNQSAQIHAKRLKLSNLGFSRTGQF